MWGYAKHRRYRRPFGAILGGFPNIFFYLGNVNVRPRWVKRTKRGCKRRSVKKYTQRFAMDSSLIRAQHRFGLDRGVSLKSSLSIQRGRPPVLFASFSKSKAGIRLTCYSPSEETLSRGYVALDDLPISRTPYGKQP
jgi:hypothetical protein